MLILLFDGFMEDKFSSLQQDDVYWSEWRTHKTQTSTLLKELEEEEHEVAAELVEAEKEMETSPDDPTSKDKLKQIQDRLDTFVLFQKKIHVIVQVLSAYGASSFYSSDLLKAVNEGTVYLEMPPPASGSILFSIINCLLFCIQINYLNTKQ